MKLKALKEKRNNLLNDLEAMVSGLENEGEVRSLSVEEREAFDAKKVEIENIDATIERIEETRAKAISEEAVVELHEERSRTEIENRAVESFFRGNDLTVEERTMLTTTGNSTALMPVEISKTIMKRLEEQCPILDKAKKFNSKGTLRLILEGDYGQAGVTAENVGFHNAEVDFNKVELNAFKVTAMINSTFEMLKNTDIDLTSYFMDVLVRRLAKELNRLFLVGTGAGQAEGLTKKGIKHNLTREGITIGDFISMQTAVHPDYLNGACWIVSRSVFSAMANLLDGAGRPYLIANYDSVNNKIQYMFLGLPVIVDNNMKGLDAGSSEVAVVMANIGEAYAINILADITVRHLTEVGFTQGYETFAGYVLADGRVVNEEAIVLGVNQ